MISNPTATLLRKETRLQLSAILFATFLWLCWAPVALAGAIAGGREMFAGATTVADVCAALNLSIVAALLAAAPATIGAGMFAQERSLGVLDWDLSLPASRARRVATKAAVAFALTSACVVSAYLMLAAFDRFDPLRRGRRATFELLPLAPFAYVFGAMAAYRSSLARSAGSALLACFPFAAFTWIAADFADPEWFAFAPFLQEGFFRRASAWYCAWLFSLTAALVVLAAFNHRFEPAGLRRMLAQGFLWFATIFAVVRFGLWAEHRDPALSRPAGPSPAAASAPVPMPLLRSDDLVELLDIRAIPGTDRLLANAVTNEHVMGLGARKGYRIFDRRTVPIVEIDLATNRVRGKTHVRGFVTDVRADYGFYFVEGGRAAALRFPVAFARRAPFWPIVRRLWPAPESDTDWIREGLARATGEPTVGLQPLEPTATYFVAGTFDHPRRMLVQRFLRRDRASGEFVEIDRRETPTGSTPRPLRLTRDAKWYEWPRHVSGPTMEIVSIDRATTRTLLADDFGPPGRFREPMRWRFAERDPSLLPTSPDGRVFVADRYRWSAETGDRSRLSTLDLETGEERPFAELGVHLDIAWADAPRFAVLEAERIGVYRLGEDATASEELSIPLGEAAIPPDDRFSGQARILFRGDRTILLCDSRSLWRIDLPDSASVAGRGAERPSHIEFGRSGD